MCDKNLSNLSGLIILNVLLKTHGVLNEQEKANYKQMAQEMFDFDFVLKKCDYDLRVDQLRQSLLCGSKRVSGLAEQI